MKKLICAITFCVLFSVLLPANADGWRTGRRHKEGNYRFLSFGMPGISYGMVSYYPFIVAAIPIAPVQKITLQPVLIDGQVYYRHPDGSLSWASSNSRTSMVPIIIERPMPWYFGTWGACDNYNRRWWSDNKTWDPRPWYPKPYPTPPQRPNRPRPPKPPRPEPPKPRPEPPARPQPKPRPGNGSMSPDGAKPVYPANRPGGQNNLGDNRYRPTDSVKRGTYRPGDGLRPGDGFKPSDNYRGGTSVGPGPRPGDGFKPGDTMRSGGQRPGDGYKPSSGFRSNGRR